MSVPPEVIVAVLALVGTALGSTMGVLTANKLTVYRIDQLEKKVDKHNSVIERMGRAEQSLDTAWEQIDELKEIIKK